jgi:hypothetical protein
MADDDAPRPDRISPEANTALPIERFVREVYVPTYGRPRDVIPLFGRAWATEMAGLTITGGRPLTRVEYESWSEHLAPHINLVGVGGAITTLYLLTIPFSKKMTFPFLSRGPASTHVFPAPWLLPRLPHFHGRTSLALWKATRAAYVLALSSVVVGTCGGFMYNSSRSRASKDQRLAEFFKDSYTNSTGLLKELNFNVAGVERASNSDLGIKVSLERRSVGGEAPQGQDKEKQISLTDLLALRGSFNEAMKKRGEEGTWYRIKKGEEGEQWEGEQTGRQQEGQGGYQDSHQEEPQAEPRQQYQEKQQSWQDQDRDQEKEQSRDPEQSRESSWDAIRAAAEKRQHDDQQQPHPTPSSSQSSIDNAGPWSADPSLDDASPVAPAHRSPRPGAPSVPARTWDEIRQETRNRAEQRQQERQQGFLSPPKTPRSSSSSAGAGGASGSSWDAVRSRAQRRPEDEHTFTEEQRGRETAKQQAQDEFDRMIERERRAAAANDGKKW